MANSQSSNAASRADRLIARGRKLLDNWDDETDIDRAEVLFRQATELAPDQGEGWRGLGDVLWENEEYQQAIGAYQRAHELGVDSAALWRRIATAYTYLPDHVKESLAAIERALALAPADSRVLEDYLQILMDLKEWERPERQAQAIAIMERAYSLAPDDPGVLDEYVGVLIALGNHGQPHYLEQALAVQTHLLAIAPPDSSKPWTLRPLYTYCGLLCLLGQMESALAAMDRYTQLAGFITGVVGDVKREDALTGRATILEVAGRYDEALLALEEYLRTAYEPKSLWRAMHAHLLVRVGRAQAAIEEIEAVLVDPESAPLAYPLRVHAEALAALARHDEAAEAQAQADRRPKQTAPLDLLLPSA